LFQQVEDVWCLAQLTFYDENDIKLVPNPSFGSAETVSDYVYIQFGQPPLVRTASNAFDSDEDSFYCSLTDNPTGWLAYDFQTPTTVIFLRDNFNITSSVTTTELRIMSCH
jgi:hypothetical protein